MLRKIFWVLLSGILCWSSLAPAADRSEVAETVQAWSGEQGIQVWTLRYGAPQDHKALVQITQVDHPWNRKIQLMEVEKKGKRRDYSVSIEGKKYVALIINSYSRGELYLPGEKEGYSVSYDENLSQEGNAQYFLTDYLQQEKR